jgi:LemA protein
MTPLNYIFIALAVVVVAVVLIHNAIRKGRNAVTRSWADVLIYERQKLELVPRLEQIVTGFQAYERGLMERIAELRSGLGRMGTEPDGAALAAVEKHSGELMKALHVAVEAYPSASAVGPARDLMGQLVQLQKEVTAALTIFNRNVELFNDSLQVFPNGLVNAMVTRAKPVPAFSDPQASSSFSYAPNS